MSDTPLGRLRRLARNVMKLPKDDLLSVEFACAVALSVTLGRETEPVWGIILGPVGDGKSEIALAMVDWPNRVTYVDDLTTNALMSANPVNQAHASILLNIDGKMMIIKDLTTLLSKHEKEQAAILGQLRTAFDGDYNKHSGTLGQQAAKARFGFLACGTPPVEGMLNKTKKLGERFLLFRLRRKADISDAEEDQDLDNTLDFSDHKEDFKREMLTVSAMLFEAEQYAKTQRDRPTHNEKQRTVLKAVAKLVVWFRDTPDEDTPGVRGEMARRIVQQLRNLADAHAQLDRRNYWDKTETRLIRRVAVDTVPWSRIAIVKQMVRKGVGAWVTTDSVVNGVGGGKNKRERIEAALGQWEAIGVARKRTNVAQQVEWQFTEKAQKALTESRLMGKLVEQPGATT